MTNQDIEQRIEDRKANLAKAGFGAPIPLGDGFAHGVFASECAPCLKCGALVLLPTQLDLVEDGSEVRPDHPVCVHVDWHARLEAALAVADS